MGSFNTACFVSNQTIGPGQKVYVTALHQSHDFGPVEVTHKYNSGQIEIYSVLANKASSYNSNAFWTPISEFISAEYDDYGRVILDDTPENLRKVRSLIAHLTKACPTVDVGENKYHDVAFNLKTKPELTEKSTYYDHVAVWNHLWEAVSEQRAFIVRNSVTSLLGFSIMSQHAGDYMVAELEKLTDWDNNSLAMKALLERKTNSLISRYNNFASVNKDRDLAVDFVVSFTSQELSRLSDFGISDTKLPIIAADDVDIHTALESQYKTVGDLTYPITAETLDKLYECLYSRLQFLYITGGLNRLNLMFSPMIYTGQDYVNELGRKYLTLVEHVATKIKKDIDARNDDEDYEDDA